MSRFRRFAIVQLSNDQLTLWCDRSCNRDLFLENSRDYARRAGYLLEKFRRKSFRRISNFNFNAQFLSPINFIYRVFGDNSHLCWRRSRKLARRTCWLNHPRCPCDPYEVHRLEEFDLPRRRTVSFEDRKLLVAPAVLGSPKRTWLVVLVSFVKSSSRRWGWPLAAINRNYKRTN